MQHNTAKYTTSQSRHEIPALFYDRYALPNVVSTNKFRLHKWSYSTSLRQQSVSVKYVVKTVGWFSEALRYMHCWWKAETKIINNTNNSKQLSTKKRCIPSFYWRYPNHVRHYYLLLWTPTDSLCPGSFLWTGERYLSEEWRERSAGHFIQATFDSAPPLCMCRFCLFGKPSSFGCS